MMKRNVLLLFLLLLVLAACAQSTQAPSLTPQVGSVEAGKAECRVVAGNQPNPTLEALLPPPTDKDWVQGPATAAVTLIEYSDFQ
jgi:protein-disulfide isomerase